MHRFTLDGGYAGPATNQRDALVHMPRGMAASSGLLVVADSWAGDSSIAFFGKYVVSITPWSTRGTDPLDEPVYS